jgi:HSP20 family protein
MSDQTQDSAKSKAGQKRPFLDLISRRKRQIDRFMEEVAPLLADADAPIPARVPMDLIQTANGFELQVEAPGLEPGDIAVTVHDGRLTIQGEKACVCETENKKYCQIECGHGAFSRSIDLPEGANVDRIAASLGKGVLTVALPVGGEAEPRRIAVTAAG